MDSSRRTFGTKLETVLLTLRAKSRPVDAGAVVDESGTHLPSPTAVRMQVVISLVALLWGTLIILGVADADMELKMAACGWVGSVIGFWMG